MNQPQRRQFLQHTGQWAAAGAVTVSQVARAHAADDTATESKTGNRGGDSNRRIVVGVMGLQRGRSLARNFARQPGVELRYLCDADTRRIDAARKSLIGDKSLQANNGIAPVAKAKGTQDFRQLLDDPELDALVCAAPNHWHAPATILACQAGKHVYVEKPCSHNPWEGEAMVRVADQHNRVVQLGTQRRSSPGTRLAMQRLHEGAIGRPYLARAWYHNARGSIGHGNPASVPSTLDYSLWQGPAPHRPYRDNVVHYNWHWRWHWGNGELGNNGIHTLDLCRWGLGVGLPSRVSSVGGRYAFQDDQETPDTHTVGFEFSDGPGKAITWHGCSCNRHRSPFVCFYGTEGTLELDSNGNFRIFDKRDELQEKHTGSNVGDVPHIDNFLQAIRSGQRGALHAPISEGHMSTLLCHLGNIAHRTGRALQCDAESGHIQNDPEAMAFWQREYAPAWEPKV